nr:thiamine phosphate synthase [uncultured Cetobacterium sp.]
MNKKINPLPHGVYAITDSKSGKDKDLLTYCEELLKGGAKILQYREKYKKMGEKLKEAKSLRELTKKYGATFIINDHVDIALLVKADGIHIGQDDFPISEVRKLIGENMIIGLSTHSPAQAQKALEDGADYIGVGPIFSTDTKDDVCDPVGLDYLNFVENNISIPYVAIGGIKTHNINTILKYKTKCICLVSELVGAKNTEEVTRNINKGIINGFYEG